MDIYQLKNLSEEERLTVFQGEAMRSEEQVYARQLTEIELSEHKEEFAQNSILTAVIEDEFADVKSNYKAKLEPLKEKRKTLLEAIKTRTVQEAGIVHLLPDYDNQMVYVVTKAGDVLHSRRMKPEERQFQIGHQLNKAI